MLRRRLALSCIAALIAASPLRAPAQEGPAPDPRLRREAMLPSPKPLVDPEGRFEVLAPARLVGEVVDKGGSLQLRLDLGTENPAECWLYREETDLAATLWRNSEAALPAEGPARRRVYTIAATIHQDIPILISDWIYREKGKPGEIGGLLKQMIATVNGRSLYCRHDELGYSQTFAQLFVALAATLEWKEPGPAAPRYLELSLATIGKRPIGFERLAVFDEDAGLRAERRTAYVLPAGAENMEVADGIEVEWLDAEGGLTRSVLAQLSNGEPTAQVSLVREPDGSYRATGSTALREIATTPGGASAPLSLLGERKLLARLAKSAPAEAEALEWVPQIDAGRFLPARFATRLAVASGEIPATIRIGDAPAGGDVPLEIRLRVDLEGSSVQRQVILGKHRISLRRVRASGKLP